MKCIVTGGAGFIGSHLVEELIKCNYKVIVLDNLISGNLTNLKKVSKNITFIKCDLSKNKNSWSKYFKNADYVFHLAAMADIVPSIDNPELYYNANVLSSLNVMQACKKYKIKKIIYAASSSCYGIPKKYPTDEKEIIDPRYPYALTKYLGERIVMHWSEVYNIPAISLRLFNVYGPRSRTSGSYGAVFGVFLAQKLANKPFTVVGNGKQTRDFTFVTDVVEAFIISAKSRIKNEIFNIGSDNTYSVNKLVSLLKGKVVYIPKRPGEPDCTWANTKKIKKMLKWKPKIKLEKGVNILLENIDLWKKAPVWNKKTINKATKLWFKHLS
tara:strand:- start:3673 stop:4653 length:981 start_codon:yes stop_codon:yes gene_type:complete